MPTHKFQILCWAQAAHFRTQLDHLTRSVRREKGFYLFHFSIMDSSASSTMAQNVSHRGFVEQSSSNQQSQSANASGPLADLFTDESSSVREMDPMTTTSISNSAQRESSQHASTSTSASTTNAQVRASSSTQRATRSRTVASSRQSQ